MCRFGTGAGQHRCGAVESKIDWLGLDSRFAAVVHLVLLAQCTVAPCRLAHCGPQPVARARANRGHGDGGLFRLPDWRGLDEGGDRPFWFAHMAHSQ